MIELPPPFGAPISFVALAARPTQAAIVQDVFPLTPAAASTPAQILQALTIAGSGLARIDAFLTAAQVAVINSVPAVLITNAQVAAAGLGSAILVPVIWSMSKTTSAIGALGTVLSLQYADPSWNGFTSMTTIAADTNNARPGQFIGMPSAGLSNTNVGVRSAVGLGLEVSGSADPGNFPASQTPMKISVVFYAWTP